MVGEHLFGRFRADRFCEPKYFALAWNVPTSFGARPQGIFRFTLCDIYQRGQCCMATLAALQFKSPEQVESKTEKVTLGNSKCTLGARCGI